jgi:lipopolysaccharide transport system permease protein
MPYVSLGLVLWTFISGSANEACGAFQESDRIIKQLRIPYSAFVLRVVWRNIIVLLHTITLYIPIALTFSVELRLTGLLALPGLFFLLWNQVWLGIVIAIVSVRYRDVPQLVATALQITMFATPIMWPVATLGGDTWIVDVNPAYHLIELIRAPLLGTAPASLSWAVVAGMCTLGTLFAMLLQRCASRQLVYWL